MNYLISLIIIMANWYYVPVDSPFVPAEVKSIDLNLKENELALSFLSLTNGEASLIQDKKGDNILINTGHQATAEELKQLLKLYKVDSISTIILTSHEEQFTGNLTTLIEEYDVKQIITSMYIADKLKASQASNDPSQDVNIHLWTKGTKQMILDDLEAEVLYNGESSNEGLDLSFTYKSNRFLILTSMGEESSNALLMQSLKNVNIVKIPCFAVASSISEKLLKHMDPQVAIIFQSKDSEPSKDILKLLQDAWLEVHYTKLHGILTIKFTPTNFEIISISKSDE